MKNICFLLTFALVSGCNTSSKYENHCLENDKYIQCLEYYKMRKHYKLGYADFPDFAVGIKQVSEWNDRKTKKFALLYIGLNKWQEELPDSHVGDSDLEEIKAVIEPVWKYGFRKIDPDLDPFLEDLHIDIYDQCRGLAHCYLIKPKPPIFTGEEVLVYLFKHNNKWKIVRCESFHYN